MSSDALIDILWANSATVIVSGTCTSKTRASTGAGAGAGVSSRRSRRPPLLPPARQAFAPGLLAFTSPRTLISFFLAG